MSRFIGKWMRLLFLFSLSTSLAISLASKVRAEERLPEDAPAPTEESGKPTDRQGMTPPWERLKNGRPDPEPAATGKALAPAKAPAPAKAKLESHADTQSGSEDRNRWFVNIGAGYGGVAYDRFYQDISTFQTLQSGTGYTITSDLGLYVAPLSSNTLFGVSGRSVTDIHFGSSTNTYYSSSSSSPFIFQGSVSASVLQYFGPAIASGFFLRADLGYAFVGAGSSANPFTLISTSSGVGALGGVGYSVNASRHVRLLIGAQASTILFLPDSPLATFQGDLTLMFGF